jgi:hypothetical protein
VPPGRAALLRPENRHGPRRRQRHGFEGGDDHGRRNGDGDWR